MPCLYNNGGKKPKQSVIIDSKIREKIPFHPSLAPINQQLANMYIVWDLISHGNRGFMTILFAMNNPITE
jgi:acetate kinase